MALYSLCCHQCWLRNEIVDAENTFCNNRRSEDDKKYLISFVFSFFLSFKISNIHQMHLISQTGNIHHIFFQPVLTNPCLSSLFLS